MRVTRFVGDRGRDCEWFVGSELDDVLETEGSELNVGVTDGVGLLSLGSVVSDSDGVDNVAADRMELIDVDRDGDEVSGSLLPLRVEEKESDVCPTVV